MSRPTRRAGLLALVALVVLAGCTAGSQRFAADPVTASAGSLDGTGYELVSTEREVTEENRTVAGQRVEVTVVNWVSTYEGPVTLRRGVTIDGAKTLVALASPQVVVGGQDRNPLAGASPAEVADRIGRRRPGLRIGNRTGARDVTVVGTEGRLVRFDATVRTADRDVPATLHVARVLANGDHVVVAGVYPERVDGAADVVTITEGLERSDPPATDAGA